MDKELFKQSCIAAFGNTWQTNIANHLNVHRQRIRQWLVGARPLPDIELELILLLEARKEEINKAIAALKKSKN